VSRLDKLEQKRDARAGKRRYHYKKFEHFKKHDRTVRRDYHLRRFNAQKKPIQKLNRLIDKEEQRIESLRINWNGCDPVGGSDLRKVIRWALNNFDVYVTSTNGGTHSTTSHHYNNDAVDLGANTQAEKDRCHRAILKKFGPGIFAELFGPENDCFVKNGVTYTDVEGGFNEQLHDNHIHVAILS